MLWGPTDCSISCGLRRPQTRTTCPSRAVAAGRRLHALVRRHSLQEPGARSGVMRCRRSGGLAHPHEQEADHARRRGSTVDRCLPRGWVDQRRLPRIVPLPSIDEGKPSTVHPQRTKPLRTHRRADLQHRGHPERPGNRGASVWADPTNSVQRLTRTAVAFNAAKRKK